MYKADRISIKKELDFMHNYLDIQRSMNARDVVVDVHVAKNMPDVQIAPSLLLSFLENAFSCVGDNELCGKRIDLSFSIASTYLFFTCFNTADPRSAERNQIPGNAILNAKKQLELQYPGKHGLHIMSHERFYQAELILQLSESETRHR